MTGAGFTVFRDITFLAADPASEFRSLRMDEITYSIGERPHNLQPSVSRAPPRPLNGLTLPADDILPLPREGGPLHTGAQPVSQRESGSGCAHRIQRKTVTSSICR